MIGFELELRWVLLGLGLLVILGVFLGGSIKSRLRLSDPLWPDPEVRPERPEEPEASVPSTGLIQSRGGFAGSIAEEGDLPEKTAVNGTHSSGGADGDGRLGELEIAPATADLVANKDRVVSLRLIPRKGGRLDAERTVQALQGAGLQYGPYGIFHYCEDWNVPESGFSVANLMEPGSFDLSNISETTLFGVAFFMALPGFRDPVGRFDKMVGLARDLCQSLDAQLFDESGHTWSVQRERHLREELSEYLQR